MVRLLTPEDIDAITAIYNYYILYSIATFEEQVITSEEMNLRVNATPKEFPWLVYEHNLDILGYAYTSTWNKRSAYKHTAESTVYLNVDQRGKGIGSQLYAELIRMLTLTQTRAIVGGISLPNPASVALHEKLGFEKVAHFIEVGYKFDEWIDVGYWELRIRP